MTQQYGLVTEFEPIHLARTPTPIPMVIAIMSEDNGAGDAVDDEWYRRDQHGQHRRWRGQPLGRCRDRRQGHQGLRGRGQLHPAVL